MNTLAKSFLFIVLLGSSFDNLIERAKEFTLNAYLGKKMQSEEWLTREARSSKRLDTFGGLDTLIKDCAAEAKRNGGIKAVNVIRVQEKENFYLVEIEVVFNNLEKSNGINPWKKEDEKWKITIRPEDRYD